MRSSEPIKIYVAAPFSKSAEVREFHRRLREDGFEVTSGWAETVGAVSGASEDLPSMRQGQREEIAADNDEGVHAAHAIVALCYAGLGKEMFCECALARLLGKPIVWVAEDIGILPLSAYRRGSVRVRDQDLAVSMLSSHPMSSELLAGRGAGWVW